MISISVIIPCYNSADTIFKCISSVLDQTFLPKEIIVIDDGSTDETSSIVKDLIINNNSNVDVILLHQTNSGPSVARNFGTSRSTSSWIAFLDSDDYWLNEKLQIQVDFLKANNRFVLLGNNNLNGFTHKEITFNMLLKHNYFQTSSVIVEKNILLDFPFNINQKYSEDYFTWLQICYKHKICLISPKMAYPIAKQLVYSGGGLSSRLFEMQKGELSNYVYFFKTSKISFFTLLYISFYSIFKYFRRVIVRLFNYEI